MWGGSRGQIVKICLHMNIEMLKAHVSLKHFYL